MFSHKPCLNSPSFQPLVKTFQIIPTFRQVRATQTDVCSWPGTKPLWVGSVYPKPCLQPHIGCCSYQTTETRMKQTLKDSEFDQLVILAAMYEKKIRFRLWESINEILAEISELWNSSWLTCAVAVGVIKPAFWHVAAVLATTAEYQKKLILNLCISVA